MRVSIFVGVLLMSLVAFASADADANANSFNQQTWNRNIENLVSSLIGGPFSDHFTPGNMTQRMSRDERIKMQLNRLRVHVAYRLSESLSEYEIICPYQHLGAEAFAVVEQELRAKGWLAHWLPEETATQCGGARGYLFVSLKK
jgi:hypothetical protein